MFTIVTKGIKLLRHLVSNRAGYEISKVIFDREDTIGYNLTCA